MKTPPGQNWQFRDQVVPARMCFLLKEKKINGSDLLLLFVIGSLVRPEGDENGLGCYASNEYLGNAINLRADETSKKISKLKHEKILVEVIWEDQRYLELAWSRTPEELESVSGEYGVLLRKAHEELRVKREDRGWDDSKGGVGNNPKGGVGNNPNQYSIVEDVNRKEVKKGEPPQLSRPPLPPEKAPSPTYPTFCYEIADSLREFLKALDPPIPGLLQETRENRAKALFRVYKSMGANEYAENRLYQLVAFYKNNYDDQRIRLPRNPSSIQSFCKNIGWIAEKFDEQRKDDDAW